jgi:lipoprotein NlpD
MNARNAPVCMLVATLLLSGCVAPPSNKRAPIEERGLVNKHTMVAAALIKPTTDVVKRPAAKSATVQKPITVPSPINAQNYIVQKGDTLFSIAFGHGLDYREVAELNKIDDPSLIKIGQQISLPQDVSQPESVEVTRPAQPVGSAGGSTLKTQPQVEKIPYSDKALAQSHSTQNQGDSGKPKLLINTDGDEDSLDWGLPAKGAIVAEFSESANRKGIDIAGKLGSPIVASAAGKVVYSGNGLRGYGKLVIIKHNKLFLSAYAHNDQVLVKEGQFVTKGQKIAEMGNTDAEQVKLHFEIRKLGKPVDPAQYLTGSKS